MLTHRRALALITALLLVPTVPARPAASPQSETWIEPYREPAARLVGEALSGSFAWERLAELGDTFGHRLSGSQSLADAIQWAVQQMKKDGLENVHTEPVKVPHWVRGQESAEIVAPRRHAMVMLGLGNSVGTPAEGVEGEILVVGSYEQLDAAADRGLVKGRIVLFNVPFTNYSDTVQFRGTGPSRAAARGAIAVLVRSVGPPGLRLPHTGALSYTEGVPTDPGRGHHDGGCRPPAAHAGSRDARPRPPEDGGEVPARRGLVQRGRRNQRGRERPDEVVVVGGHFDSWDVGTGSTDDGGGCIVTWEALRLMKKLNLRPRRTVRVVLWTNEENGGQGALAYRDRYKDQLAGHVLMLESDAGVFRPTGFGFTGSDAARARVKEIATLLRGIQADRISAAGDGADIGPSVQAAGIPAMSLDVEGNYFLIHHTPADTIDKIDPMDVARASAAIAVMTYVIAEMPERLK